MLWFVFYSALIYLAVVQFPLSQAVTLNAQPSYLATFTFYLLIIRC